MSHGRWMLMVAAVAGSLPSWVNGQQLDTRTFNAASGSWHDGSNWLHPQPPTSSTLVEIQPFTRTVVLDNQVFLIPVRPTATINAGLTASAHHVRVWEGGRLDIRGGLDTSRLSVSETTVNIGNESLQQFATVSANRDNSSGVNLSFGALLQVDFGQITARDVEIGSTIRPENTSTIRLWGSNNRLTVTRNLYLGSSTLGGENGVLDVIGADVDTSGTAVAFIGIGGTGTVSLKAGAGWTAGAINIGSGGNGTVSLEGGSTLTASQITLGTPIPSVFGTTPRTGSGSLLISEGTLNIGGLNGLAKGTGNATVGIQQATFNIVGSHFSTALPIGIFGESTIQTNTLNATFTGGINGFGVPGVITTGLTKLGTGTLFLGGSNTMDNFVYREGGFELQSGAVLGVRRLTLAPNAGENVTFTLGANRTLELRGGGAILQGAGSSEFRFAGGTIRLLDGSDSIVPMILSNASTIDTNGQTLGLGGNLTGSGDLVRVGAGTLGLSGNNTFSGGYRQTGGHTSVINQRQLGTGSITIQGGSVQSTGEFASDAPITLSNGGSLTAGLYLETGINGNSSIAVNSGGVLASLGTAAIGASAGRTGTVTLSGAGSALNVATNLYLGLSGSGDLTVGSGSVVSAGTVIFAENQGSAGSLTLNPGSLLLVGGTNGIRRGLVQVVDPPSMGGSGIIEPSAGGGSGSLVPAGTAAFNLAGGEIRVTGSSLTVTTLPVDLTNGSRIDTNGFNALFAGGVRGSGSLTKAGAGTLSLVGTNSFSGGLSVVGGTVEFADGSNLGTGGVHLDGGTLRWFAGNTHDISGRLSIGPTSGVLDTAGNNVNFASGFAAAGTLRRVGLGTLTLSAPAQQIGGNFVSDGGELVTAGTINVGGYFELASTTTANWTANGGGLTTGATAAFGVLAGSSGVGILNNASLRVGTDLYVGYQGSAALVANSGSVVSADNLVLGVFGGPGTFVLNTGSTLEIGGTNAIRVGAGTGFFQWYGGQIKVTGESLTTAIPLALQNTSTIDTSGVSATLSGLLSGTGALVKTGGGTLNLSTGNTYSGGTTVLGGEILISESSALGGGAVQVQGGMVRSTGSFVREGSVAVSGPSTLRAVDLVFGNSAASQVEVTGGGAIVGDSSAAFGLFAGSSGTASFTGNGSSLSAPLIYTGYYGTGNMTVGGGGSVTGSLVLGLFAGSSGNFTLNTGGTLNVGGTDGIARGSGSSAFQWAGGTIKVINSSLSTTVPMTLSGASAIDTSGVEAMVFGQLSGTGGLTKTGGGNLYLADGNTYSGGTTLLGGTIAIGAASALGTGNVSIQGGTLSIGSAYSVDVDVAVTGGSSFLTGSGDLVFGTNGTGRLILTQGGRATTTANATFSSGNGLGDGSVTGTGSRLDVGGTIHLGVFNIGGVAVGSGGTVQAGVLHFGAGGGSGTFSLNSGGTLEIGGTNGIRSNGTATFNWNGGTLKVTGSSLTTSVAMAINANSIIDTSGVNAVLGGQLTGSGNLAKIGGGTLFLNGSNVFSGGVTHYGGQIEFAGASSLGSGIINLAGGELRWAPGNSADISVQPANSASRIQVSAASALHTNGNDVTLSSGLSGAAVTKLGTGLLTLGGTSSLTGNLTVNGGGVRLTGQLTTPRLMLESGTFTVNTGSTLNVGGTDGILRGAGNPAFEWAGGMIKVTNSTLSTTVPMTLSGISTIDTSGVEALIFGQLSGTGGLVKTGGGNLYLATGNTYSGGTTLVGGTIAVATASALGKGHVTIQGGTLSTGAAYSVDADVTVTGEASFLTGSGDLAFGTEGTGRLIVTQGGRAATTGNVAFSSGNGLGDGSVTGIGSRLNVGGTLHLGVFNIGGVAVGSGGTVQTGLLHFGAGGGSGIFSLNSGGTLEIGGTNGIRSNGTATFNWNGGTLKVTGSSLTTSVPLAITTTSTIDTSGFYAVLSGQLTGNGTLRKTGVGTLVLTAENTFTGLTTVEEGELRLNGLVADIEIFDGGRLGGTGTAAEIIAQAGAVVAPGNSIGTLFTESLVWESGATFEFELGNGTSDQIIIANAFQKSGSGPFTFQFLNAGWVPGQTFALVEFGTTNFTADDFSFNTGDLQGAFSLTGNTLEFTAIPEPGTVALVGLGLLVTLATTRRHRGQRQNQGRRGGP